MDNKARRIVIACFLGAMLGVYIATLLPFVIWWLGAVVGGATAGFVFALPEIVRYAPTAAKITWQTLIYIPQIWNRIVFIVRTIRSGVRAVREVPSAKKWQAAPFLIFCGNFLAWIFMFMLGLHIEENGRLSWFLVPFIGMGIYLIYTELVWGILMNQCRGAAEEVKIKTAKRAVLLQSPAVIVVLLLLALKVVPRLIAVTPKLVWEFVRFLAMFGKTLFLYVHSRELVLCMVDTGLAVCVGYLFFVRAAGMDMGPTLLLSGCVGALLGFLNYQLVSRHILHLA